MLSLAYMLSKVFTKKISYIKWWLCGVYDFKRMSSAFYTSYMNRNSYDIIHEKAIVHCKTLVTEYHGCNAAQKNPVGTLSLEIITYIRDSEWLVD